MKKNELVAIACLLCFCCCNGTEKEVPNPDLQEELSPIQFTIDLQKEVLPFPVTKSIPELNIPEPIPQNPDAEEDPSTPDIDPDNLYNRIDYIVYQSGKPDILVKHKQFTPQDPDFTIIYDSLPSGDYHICFLAHSDKNISVSGQTALFSKVSDTFHLFLTQEVQTGERIFFTFIPAPEFMLKAHLSAKNQINEVTREREVNDILPLINHIIRYTGILYTPKESDDTFTLDILNGGKWDSPIDKDLKD